MAHAGAVWFAVQDDLYRRTSTGAAPLNAHVGSSSSSSRQPREPNSTSNVTEPRRCMDRFDDHFLSQCFHLTRPCLSFLIDYINACMNKDDLKPTNNNAEPVTLAALYFYAHGFLPEKIADMLGLQPSSAGEAVIYVTKILSERATDFITFPGSYNDRMGVAQVFKNVSSIPNVVGVLGCLHVRVKPSPSEEKLFLNTLGFHSVMVQLISDVDGNLLSVEQCCPGATLEQAVWEKSRICQEFDMLLHGQTWVVGGRGLSKGKHVLTPVEPSEIKTAAAQRFNAAHSQILSSNQQVFGSLKTRFQCLRGLGAVQVHALQPVARVILACCVLHNISKKFSVPLPTELVLEPVHPVLEMRKDRGEKPMYSMEETKEDMIEMCFGNTGDEKKPPKNAGQS